MDYGSCGSWLRRQPADRLTRISAQRGHAIPHCMSFTALPRLPGLPFDDLLLGNNVTGVREDSMSVHLGTSTLLSRRQIFNRRRFGSMPLGAIVLGLFVQLLGPSPTYAQANISVGSGPVLAVAAIQLAVAKDYFKEEGLNV